MADIELVIKIPERIHYGIEKGITVNGSQASQILIDAVKNGTPLPKGHWNDIRDNRVKDELNRTKNELEPTTENDKVDCEHTDCNNCVNHKYCDYESTTKNDLGVDCISRQAALEQAYAYGNGLEPDGYCVNVEDIQALPPVTPQEPRWIPCSEKLPEDHKDVLAYLSSDRISICRYNSHKLPFSNDPIGWGYLPGIGFIDFEKEHVIAWMPLPKPYREVEK